VKKDLIVFAGNEINGLCHAPPTKAYLVSSLATLIQIFVSQRLFMLKPLGTISCEENYEEK